MKILCVGNSFSEDATAHLVEIAKSTGESLTVGNLYIGGCPLLTHLNNLKTDAPAYTYYLNEGAGFTAHANAVLSTTVKSEAWDIITLQQASNFSGKEETYDTLLPLLQGVKELCPTAKFYFHMTWAYQKDSTHPAFPAYGRDQAKMYADILAAVQKRVLTNGEITGVIPSGTAIQNARGVFGDNLTRDGFHLSLSLGRYIAGLTYFTALTGQALDTASYLPEGVTEEQSILAKKCVENAMKTPFAVTELSNETLF